VPKQKKNSPEDELYFDIVSPSQIEEEEELEEDNSPKIKSYQIPIRKEKFNSMPKIKTMPKEEELADDEEYEEIVEEVEVDADEPEEEIIYKPAKKSKKGKKLFSFFKRNKKEKVEKIPRKKAKKEPKVRVTREGGGFKKKLFITVGLASLVLIFGFVLLTFAFNNATISINTQKGNIDYTGNILVDSNIKTADFTKNVLPGRLIKISKTVTKEFESTGKINGGAKAKGKITIYNAYNTSSQILVQNTRFESADGLIFKLDSRITVPGASLKNGEIVPSSILANVTAAENGVGYNISAGRFTIPGFKGTDRFTGFYADSKDKFAGGTDGQSTVVSSVDLKNAEKSAMDVLSTQLDTELKSQIQSHEKTFKDSIVVKVVKIDFNGVKAGDSKLKFNANITGEIKTIAFSSDDYNTLIKTNVEKELKDGEELYGSFTENIASIKPDDKKNQILINTIIKYPTKKNINSTEIINTIKGKSLVEVKKILSTNPAIEKVNIKLYPI
jgi:hypothetical protein